MKCSKVERCAGTTPQVRNGASDMTSRQAAQYQRGLEIAKRDALTVVAHGTRKSDGAPVYCVPSRSQPGTWHVLVIEGLRISCDTRSRRTVVVWHARCPGEPRHPGTAFCSGSPRLRMTTVTWTPRASRRVAARCRMMHVLEADLRAQAHPMPTPFTIILPETL